MNPSSTVFRGLLVLCLSLVSLTNAHSQLNYWERLAQFPSAHPGDPLSVEAIYVTPSGKYVVATSLGSGVYHSQNRGTSWTTAKPFGNYDHGYALCVNSEGEIYVLSNRAGSGTDKTSVSKSIDEGVTYTKTNFPDSITAGSLACSSTGNLFVGTIRKGVYRSTDNGATYTPTTPLPISSARPITSLLVASNGTLYAGTDGEGLFQSTDNGDTWTLVTNDVTMNNIECLHQDNNGVLYSGTNYGVYRSVDQGKTWQEILNTGTGSSSVKSVLVSTKDKKIYAGVQGEGVYFSADNGESWTQITSGFKAATVSVIARDSSGSILVGTSQDLYRNRNAPILSVKNKVIDFGSVKNSVAKDTTFTLTNIGDSTLDITDMKIAGFDPADFQITMKEPVSLEPNAAKTYTVRCLSKKNGDKDATLVFTSTTSGLTTEINLLATVSGTSSVDEGSMTAFTADVFPNPVSASSATIKITSPLQADGELRLISTLGIPVFSSEFTIIPATPLHFEMPLPANIANGMYQAVVSVGGKSISIPLSVIR